MFAGTFQTLSGVGLTPNALQLIVVAAIFAVLLAMFWRVIIIGTGMLIGAMFVVAIFAQQTPGTAEAKNPPTESVIPEGKSLAPPVVTPIEVKPEPVKEEVTGPSVKDQFMIDCQSTDYNKSQCEAIWKNGDEPTS